MELENKSNGISLAAATAIVIASMVGTGVFTSLGFQIASIPSGFPLLLLWGFGGVVALCGALCYAELTAMMPRSGGEYHLLGQAYHPLAGFLAGWVSITAGFSATVALMAMAFGAYVHGVWPLVDASYAAFAVIVVLTFLRLAGAQFTEKFHVTITVVKILLIFAFILGAVLVGKSDWEVLRPKAGDQARVFSSDFATSLFWVMFSYSGWNGAAYVAGEMRNPKRNVPLALGLGTLIVAALYVSLNAVFLTGGDWAAMSGQKDVGRIAAQNIFGESGGALLGVLIAFGLLSTINAMLWAGSSTLRVIGQDYRALCWLDATDRRGEPVGAVLFMSCLAFVILGTGSFESLLNYIQALLELCAALGVAGVIWLRYKSPDRPRPFKVPLYPLPPLLFLGVSAWMLYSLLKMRPAETAWSVATLGIGAVVYWFSPKDAPKTEVESAKPEES
jgi:APA family basic amino acid/polyamine antiporter